MKQSKNTLFRCVDTSSHENQLRETQSFYFYFIS